MQSVTPSSLFHLNRLLRWSREHPGEDHGSVVDEFVTRWVQQVVLDPQATAPKVGEAEDRGLAEDVRAQLIEDFLAEQDT